MHLFKNIPFVILAISFLNIGCNTSFLDTQPLDQYSEEAVWKDQALSQAFINNIYKRLWPSPTHSYLWDASLVDEATGWYCFNEFQNCIITPDNIPCWEGKIWGDYFYCYVNHELTDRVVLISLLHLSL